MLDVFISENFRSKLFHKSKIKNIYKKNTLKMFTNLKLQNTVLQLIKNLSTSKSSQI